MAGLFFLAVHVPIDSRCGQAMMDNVEFCLCLYTIIVEKIKRQKKVADDLYKFGVESKAQLKNHHWRWSLK